MSPLQIYLARSMKQGIVKLDEVEEMSDHFSTEQGCINKLEKLGYTITKTED